jgi:hypothetical protein
MAIFPPGKTPPATAPQSAQSSAPQSPASAQSAPQPAQKATPKPSSYAGPIPQNLRWRPTAEEALEIEDLAYTALASGLLKSQIKKQLRKYAEKKQAELNKAGNGLIVVMDARTIEKYLSRARARMVDESGKTEKDLRTDSLNFYLSIARDQTADHRSRLIARERVDRLYGLDKPIKVAPTTPDGEQSFRALSDADLTARIAEIAAKIGAGATAGSDGGVSEPGTAETGDAEDRAG